MVQTPALIVAATQTDRGQGALWLRLQREGENGPLPVISVSYDELSRLVSALWSWYEDAAEGIDPRAAPSRRRPT